MGASALAGSAPLMTMTDIAELAGVQRPVVSNWRRRSLGFPEPVGGDERQALFDPRAVTDWLLATGRVDRERAEQELSLFMLTGLAARYDGPDVAAAVTALICLRYLAGEYEPLSDGVDDPVATARALALDLDPDDRVLLDEIRAIPSAANWLVSLVDEFVEASWNCRDAFERVMAARHRLNAGALSAVAVVPPLTRLVAELSGATERARRGGPVLVADPAAGSGDLLAAVLHLLGPDSPPAIAAAGTDPVLTRLIRRRLLVQGVPLTDMDVVAGTDLPDGLGDPDVIVTQVPYQSGEVRDVNAVLDAVGDVAVRLSPGRFGVVLGPAAVLTGDLPPFSAGERARTGLLKGDMVEAIIRLPGGLVPFRPGYETALWILTQARDSRWKGRVLRADVSDRELTDEVIRDLVEDVVTWRREGYTPGAHRRVYGAQVLVRDLVDPPRPLLVSERPSSPRERETDANRRITAITQCGVDLDRLAAMATADRRHVGTEALAAADLHPAMETIGALTRSKRLTLRGGTRIDPAHIVPSGTHVVLGTEEVLGIRRPGGRQVDREIFARNYPKSRLTEPGDVLVTTIPRPGAMVDSHGYAIAEFPVRILRIPPAETEQFTPRVLAALLFAGSSGDRASGAVRAGRAIEEQQVLLLPPERVRALDQILAQLHARRDLAERELDVLDELQHVVTGGLIDGTLTLTSDEANGQEDY